MIKIALIPLILSGLLWSFAVLANGGDQRVVDGKYLINLSRAPFTPRIGNKVSFLTSFVDIQRNKLISEDLIARVRIARLGGSENREFIYEQKDIKVTGGVLDFSYTFNNTGLHEIFFDFTLASDPQNIHEAPDFLLDIQKTLNGYSTNQILMAALSSLVIGLIAGWFVKTIVSGAVG